MLSREAAWPELHIEEVPRFAASSVHAVCGSSWRPRNHCVLEAVDVAVDLETAHFSHAAICRVHDCGAIRLSSGLVAQRRYLAPCPICLHNEDNGDASHSISSSNDGIATIPSFVQLLHKEDVEVWPDRGGLLNGVAQGNEYAT